MNEKNDSTEEKIISYYIVFKRNMFLVFFIIGIIVSVALVKSLLSPKIYQSQALIMPIQKQRLFMNIGTIAESFGLSSGPTEQETEVVYLLSSDVLAGEVIEKYNLLPELLTKAKPDWSPYFKMRMGVLALKSIVSITHNKKDHIILISAQHSRPERAKKIVEYFLIVLMEHVSAQAKRIAETNKTFLENSLGKTSDPIIRNKIYDLIAQQVETSMMAELKENISFKIIDPPTIPTKNIKPKILKNIELAFIGALFLSIVVVYVKEYYRNMKEYMISNILK